VTSLDGHGPTKADVPVFVIGAVNIDLVFRVDALPRAGQTVLARSPQELNGGKGGNQAVAAARLGADVRMVACVGTDSAGDRALASLRAAGVDGHSVQRRGTRTGTATVLVCDDGENAIIVSPAANSLLEPADVDVALADARSGIVLISLEVPLAAANAAAVAASARGLTVVLNPAPAHVLSRELLASCDVLIPNEHEVGELGQPNIGALLATGTGAVVVTRGAAGAEIHRKEMPVRRIPAFPVDAVDTTGAGDAFCGGFAWALSTGRSLESAVTAASATGALATRRTGARASLPSLAEMHDLFPDVLVTGMRNPVRSIRPDGIMTPVHSPNRAVR